MFVDTNVLLSFYAFTSDDIEQLRKLEGLIENGTLKLYVSRQVADEFARNRETKLAKSIDDFAAKGSMALPRFLADTEEGDAYSKAVQELDKARNTLVQKAKASAAENSFAVDELVHSLIEKAGVGEVTQEMIERARLRRDVGNPPGKDKSLGDQINWEYLLECVDDGVDLHVVSIDGDYKSALKNGKPHQFLIDEWKKHKNAELYLHKELKPFLNRQFEIIKLEVDKEKAAAINRLIESGSFAMTHLAVSQLQPFSDALTANDAGKLVRGGLDNDQVRWIAGDSDVRAFYTSLLDRFTGQLDFGLEADADDAFRAKPIPDLSDEDIDEIVAKL
ncbi:PIN domain-containing protein [Sphingomonas sp. NY01]|uniref:PIN domain-containing protein n=1 Tax=Sphingomonas sp. NY01 TaxID=2968057 RepID=UPI00315DEBB1